MENWKMRLTRSGGDAIGGDTNSCLELSIGLGLISRGLYGFEAFIIIT